MNDPHATLHLRFGREALPTFAHRLGKSQPSKARIKSFRFRLPMTMEHIARSFSVPLSISHPDIDPVEISRAVNLTPKRMTRAGAPRTTPKGDPLEGTYQFSHWTYEF